MKIIKFLIVIFFLISITFDVLGQKSKSIYFFKERYDKSVQNEVLNIYNNIKIIGASSIYRNYNSNIDLDLYKRNLLKLIPDRNDNSLLCIDIENIQFEKLKKGNLSEQSKSANAFYELLKLTKSLRPKLKIGFYGIPFNFYYDSQNTFNSIQKFGSLLNEVDVLFPSVYIYYPEKQKGVNSNLQYLEKNLVVALNLGTKFNKPVYPFFWYLVHPSNKKFGYSMLSKDEVNQYLSFMNNFTYNGKSISGIIWWDTITPYNKKMIKNNSRNINETLKYYMSK